MPKTKTSFKPGQIANPKGKPKGTKSAKTRAWEELGEYLIKEGADKFIKVLMKSKDKDFVFAYEKLLNYFKPRLAQESHKIETEQTINVKFDDKDQVNTWE